MNYNEYAMKNKFEKCESKRNEKYKWRNLRDNHNNSRMESNFIKVIRFFSKAISV